MPLINQLPETVFTTKVDELLNWGRASSQWYIRCLIRSTSSRWRAAPTVEGFFSLTKVHRRKETGEIFRQYAGRYDPSSQTPLQTETVPKKFQLELIGTESEDRLDRKVCPWDTVKLHEVDEGAKLSKYSYEPKALEAVKGVFVTNAVEEQSLEEKQLELYESDQ